MTSTIKKPLVSFCIVSYNQESYIAEAVEGAFSQKYDSMEIIISDDHSSDNTSSIIQEKVQSYAGGHDVKFIQNEFNMGVSSHINSVVSQSRGEYVVIAAGDDISYPSRVYDSVMILEDNPSASSVLLSVDEIDNNGCRIGERVLAKKGEIEIQTINSLLDWSYLTLGASRAIRKSIFDKFGPLSDSCPTEDTPLLLRSLMMGGVALSSKKGVLYRVHDRNLSTLASMGKMNNDAIYEQYKGDVFTALKFNIIGPVAGENIFRWINFDYRARMIKIDCQLGNKIPLGHVFFALKSKSFTLRQKAKVVAGYLSSISGGKNET